MLYMTKDRQMRYAIEKEERPATEKEERPAIDKNLSEITKKKKQYKRNNLWNTERLKRTFMMKMMMMMVAVVKEVPFLTSSSVASGLPYRMFSMTVVANKMGSCKKKSDLNSYISCLVGFWVYNKRCINIWLNRSL